jgi:hypothetical protein
MSKLATVILFLTISIQLLAQMKISGDLET